MSTYTHADSSTRGIDRIRVPCVVLQILVSTSQHGQRGQHGQHAAPLIKQAQSNEQPLHLLNHAIFQSNVEGLHKWGWAQEFRPIALYENGSAQVGKVCDIAPGNGVMNLGRRCGLHTMGMLGMLTTQNMLKTKGRYTYKRTQYLP